MLFTDVIRKKRDGGELTPEEIAFFVDGLADGSVPAEQVSALAMAVFLNSMSAEEASRLTIAMAASGSVLEWQDEGLDGPVVDKHSSTEPDAAIAIVRFGTYFPTSSRLLILRLVIASPLIAVTAAGVS